MLLLYHTCTRDIYILIVHPIATVVLFYPVGDTSSIFAISDVVYVMYSSQSRIPLLDGTRFLRLHISLESPR